MKWPLEVQPAGDPVVARMLALLLSASIISCIYDGTYVVRGTVARSVDGAVAPVAGASVSVASTSGRGSSRTAVTNEHGEFQVEYDFGAIGVLAWHSGDGEPTLHVAAPGSPPCAIPVAKTTTAKPGETTLCKSAKPPCFEYHVVLGRSRAAGDEQCRF